VTPCRFCGCTVSKPCPSGCARVLADCCTVCLAYRPSHVVTLLEALGYRVSLVSLFLAPFAVTATLGAWADRMLDGSLDGMPYEIVQRAEATLRQVQVVAHG
jgi:hypothetical protein